MTTNDHIREQAREIADWLHEVGYIDKAHVRHRAITDRVFKALTTAFQQGQASVVSEDDERLARDAVEAGDHGPNFEELIPRIAALAASQRAAGVQAERDRIRGAMIVAREKVVLVGKQGHSVRNAETQRLQARYTRGWDDAQAALDDVLQAIGKGE